MQQQLITSMTYFQQILYSNFRKLNYEIVETLLLLSSGHLFGLYNPNQVAEALEIPKATLYRHLKGLSLYQWKAMSVRLGCSVCVDALRDAEAKSASTQSRWRITISVDDSILPRYAQALAYCYKWWSKKHNNAVRSQNLLAITIKIGERIIPLNTRLVSKQGSANTDKPSCLLSMIQEVLDAFDAEGIDLRKYPITFDSWYGSKKLIDALSDLGFTCILIHGKSNYVMEIDAKTAKLSEHKKDVKLLSQQWGCDKSVRRLRAKSPTFGELVRLFFAYGGKTQTMMVFGKPLRSAEILHIWSQHHGIERFWRHLKSDVCISAMSLHQRDGAYGALGVKIISYLMIQHVSCSTRLTFHQIKLRLSGERQMLSIISAHFHEQSTQ